MSAVLHPHTRTSPVLPISQVREIVDGRLGIEVVAGARKTVLMRFEGAVLGLVQPEFNDYAHWQGKVHAAKRDLIDDIGNRRVRVQGVVYLPHNAIIRRSPEGAAEMGRNGLTYEVESGSGDKVSNAVAFIKRWRDRSIAGMAHVDQFERELWEET
jgi:hypothetical protein